MQCYYGFNLHLHECGLGTFVTLFIICFISHIFSFMNAHIQTFILRTSAFMGVYEGLLFFYVRFHEWT